MRHLLSLTRDDKNFVEIIVADYENQCRALAFEQGANARRARGTTVWRHSSVNAPRTIRFAMKKGPKSVLDYLDSMRHESDIDSQE